MRALSWWLLCCLNLLGCASGEAGARGDGTSASQSREVPLAASMVVRHALQAEEAGAPGVFLPAELLEWQQWSNEALENAGGLSTSLNLSQRMSWSQQRRGVRRAGEAVEG